VLCVAVLAACAAPTELALQPPQVTLIADGQTRTLRSSALTVRDLLAEAGITLDADDRVEPAEPTLLEDGLTVRVVRVEERTENERREVPFERRTVHDASVPAGETRLLEPGITGIEELTYRITLEDGVEIARRLARRRMVVEPRNEVLLIGAQVELKAVPISGTLAYLANRSAWVIHANSRNQRRLTYEGDLDGRVFALSPDGAYLLFTRVLTATVVSGTNAGPAFNHLWMIDTLAADAQPIALGVTNVLWADWASDCRGIPNGSDCRIAFSTGEPVEGNPNWRALNDMWIAWPRARDGRLLSLRRIVEPSAGGSFGWWGATYAWSPDGQSLAYARADEVGVIRVFSGAQTPLARFPPFRTYAAWAWTPTVSWSPEGRFIVTTLHGPAPTGGSPEDSPVFDVVAVAADGTVTAELSSEAGMWAAPQYAPRGDWIVFGRARSPYVSQTSSYDLYVMDRDGSDRRSLFPPAEEVGLSYPQLAWGPGGDSLVAVYQGNLVLITLADGAALPLTSDGSATAVRWRW
jgi:hypothetical protein